MIAIPNMNKPKSCCECPIAKSYLDCLMEKKYVCPIGNKDDCPLIEIDQEAIDIAQDIMDGCKRFKERRADEHTDKRD